MWLWFGQFITNQTSFKKWLRNPPIERMINRPLHCTDVSGAFVLLAFGWIMGFIAFICELHSSVVAKHRVRRKELHTLLDLKVKQAQRFKLNTYQKKQLQRLEGTMK